MITKSMKIPCPPYEISTTVQESGTSDKDIEQFDSQPPNEKTETISDDIPNEEESKHENLESMSTEELTKLQIDISKQNSDKPSDELQKQLDAVNDVLNKKIKDSTISAENVS